MLVVTWSIFHLMFMTIGAGENNIYSIHTVGATKAVMFVTTRLIPPPDPPSHGTWNSKEEARHAPPLGITVRPAHIGQVTRTRCSSAKSRPSFCSGRRMPCVRGMGQWVREISFVIPETTRWLDMTCVQSRSLEVMDALLPNVVR